MGFINVARITTEMDLIRYITQPSSMITCVENKEKNYNTSEYKVPSHFQRSEQKGFCSEPRKQTDRWQIIIEHRGEVALRIHKQKYDR